MRAIVEGFGLLRDCFHQLKSHVSLLVASVGILTFAAVYQRESVAVSLRGLWSLVDLQILLAVLLGAASSFCVTLLLQWRATSRQRSDERAAARVPRGGHDPIASVPASEIPDNACYFCVRRPATSKCGSCR